MGFDAKMVNIADLDDSASANSQIRQILCFNLYILVQNHKGCSSDKPLLTPKYPQGPMLKQFDAKMKVMADFFYSANTFTKMIQVFTYFPVYFSTCEENQKGCSSD